jgi:hypothetical protein
MTIHWKALEQHFLVAPLVFRFNHFQEKNAFSEFFSDATGQIQTVRRTLHLAFTHQSSRPNIF